MVASLANLSDHMHPAFDHASQSIVSQLPASASQGVIRLFSFVNFAYHVRDQVAFDQRATKKTIVETAGV